MLDQRTLTHYLKTMWASHHFIFSSKDIADIATVVNISPDRLERMMRSPNWDEALHYWGYRIPAGDLALAQKLWADMIERCEHINPVEYPDKPIKSPFGNLDVLALIGSHLFCVDNLSNTDIRDRLADDGNPVHYEGQHIRAYHWFVYPNKPLYSKALAKVNVAGDLVIDYGDDETCLVCIRYGHFTLTREVADDVANVSDDRIFVCL